MRIFNAQGKADRAEAKKLSSDQATMRADQDALKKTAQILYEALQGKAETVSVKNTLGDTRDELLSAVQTLHDNTQQAIDTYDSPACL